MKCCEAYLELFEDIFLKIELSPNLKILRTELVPAKSVPNPTAQDSCIREILDLVSKYIQGHVDADEILPHILLPQTDSVYTLLAVMSIPRGKVASYAQIASIVGSHPRVVGRIVAQNPLPVLIPCHRVVHNDGRLGGYSPRGPNIKKQLLELEGVKITPSGRVSRSDFVKDEHLRERFLRILSLYKKIPESIPHVREHL